MRFAVIGSGKLAVEICQNLLDLEGANVTCAIVILAMKLRKRALQNLQGAWGSRLWR